MSRGGRKIFIAGNYLRARLLGVLRYDLPDIAGCVAPRPLQKGVDDPFFDPADVERAFAHLQRSYDTARAPRNVEYMT